MNYNNKQASITPNLPSKSSFVPNDDASSPMNFINMALSTRMTSPLINTRTLKNNSQTGHQNYQSYN